MQAKQELNKYLGPLTQLLQHWWQQRAPREQQVLKLLGAVVVIFLLYFVLWQPMWQARHEARAAYVSAHQTYDWMAANATRIQQARAADHPSQQAGSDWVMTINQSAAAQGLALKGFTPQGDNSVRVVFEKQSFATLMAWLEHLHQSAGVLASNVQISATNDAGLVNVQVTLTGGS